MRTFPRTPLVRKLADKCFMIGISEISAGVDETSACELAMLPRRPIERGKETSEGVTLSRLRLPVRFGDAIERSDGHRVVDVTLDRPGAFVADIVCKA